MERAFFAAAVIVVAVAVAVDGTPLVSVPLVADSVVGCAAIAIDAATTVLPVVPPGFAVAAPFEAAGSIGSVDGRSFVGDGARDAASVVAVERPVNGSGADSFVPVAVVVVVVDVDETLSSSSLIAVERGGQPAVDSFRFVHPVVVSDGSLFSFTLPVVVGSAETGCCAVIFDVAAVAIGPVCSAAGSAETGSSIIAIATAADVRPLFSSVRPVAAGPAETCGGGAIAIAIAAAAVAAAGPLFSSVVGSRETGGCAAIAIATTVAAAAAVVPLAVVVPGFTGVTPFDPGSADNNDGGSDDDNRGATAAAVVVVVVFVFGVTPMAVVVPTVGFVAAPFVAAPG